MEESLQFSVVVPVLNEEDNITPLILELEQLMPEQEPFEVIFVDDHSTDNTPEVLFRYSMKFPWLRVVRLSRQSGQSAALCYGIRNARSSIIVSMDGDGQNDPSDIPNLVDVYHRVELHSRCCLVNGYRVQRKDSGWRRFSSSFANSVRSRLLKDDTPDSGCGIKVYSRERFLELSSFNHMHRFLPALIRQHGGEVVSVAVNHRPRSSGASHYGTLDRLFAGIIDLTGVLWLGKRVIPSGLVEEEKKNG
ncbi:MAG TPA: glycosyltransferase [Desulfobulbus sp.]|nr:glycosyltransferase [Desulfobulbus sp.]